MKNPIITLSCPPKISGYYSVVGHKENEGPLAHLFSEHSDDDRFGKNTWEEAESEMQLCAIKGATKASGVAVDDLDVILAGDLLNQCIGSSYALSSFATPFIGLYGACSTCAEGLALGACLHSGGITRLSCAVTSSHYCASERQFRFPLEYGGQRAPTAQWTVTGSGAFVLGDEGAVSIKEVLFGKAVDNGIKDINNMGAAMAPAAIDTLTRYFENSNHSPDFFDLIVTGDLGYEGSGILQDLLLGEGIDIRKNHRDCGLMIFDRTRQDTHAGGSGCGCSAAVLAADLLPRLERGELKHILFLGTGALMSPVSIFQGKSIPAVCHLVHLCGKEVV